MERSFKMKITLEKGLIRDWKKNERGDVVMETGLESETRQIVYLSSDLDKLRWNWWIAKDEENDSEQGFRASDTYQTGTSMNRSVLWEQAVLIRRKLCREPLQTKPSGKREDNSSIVVPYPHVLPIDSIGSASKSTSVNYSSFDLFIFTLSKTFG